MSGDNGPAADSKARRQVVKFSFYRVDPAWRSLSQEERDSAADAFCGAIDSFSDRLLIRSYSLVGMRGDADLLLWQIGDRLEDVQEPAGGINCNPLRPYSVYAYSSPCNSTP